MDQHKITFTLTLSVDEYNDLYCTLTDKRRTLGSALTRRDVDEYTHEFARYQRAVIIESKVRLAAKSVDQNA